MISLPISYTFENTKGAREEKENEMSRDWPEEISPGVSKNLRGEIRLFLPYRSVFPFFAGFPAAPLPSAGNGPHTPQPASTPAGTGQHKTNRPDMAVPSLPPSFETSRYRPSIPVPPYPYSTRMSNSI